MNEHIFQLYEYVYTIERSVAYTHVDKAFALRKESSTYRRLILDVSFANPYA